MVADFASFDCGGFAKFTGSATAFPRIASAYTSIFRRPILPGKPRAVYSVKEAAARLGISASEVYQPASCREIAHYRVGGKVLFETADLDAYLASCRVAVKASDPPLPARPRPQVALRHLSLGGRSPPGARCHSG